MKTRNQTVTSKKICIILNFDITEDETEKNTSDWIFFGKVRLFFLPSSWFYWFLWFCLFFTLLGSVFFIIVSEVAQSCPTPCDPMALRLPGSSLHGILQARVLEWVAISFFRGSSWPRDRTWVSWIPGRRFNLWATREAHKNQNSNLPGFVFV